MLRVPDVRQGTTYDCGVAGTQALCEALGVDMARKRYFSLLGTHPYNGTDPRSIETFLRGLKLRVVSGEMRLRDLTHFTRTGCPVLCLVTLHGCGHYVVVSAIKRNRVYFQDPSVGPSSLPRDGFEDVWVDYDRFCVTYRRFGIAAWRDDA